MKVEKCQMPWREFKKLNMCRAGTWIQYDGNWELIGHVNELGGLCDDCGIGDPTVTAYATLDIEDLLRLQLQLGDKVDL